MQGELCREIPLKWLLKRKINHSQIYIQNLHLEFAISKNVSLIIK